MSEEENIFLGGPYIDIMQNARRFLEEKTMRDIKHERKAVEMEERGLIAYAIEEIVERGLIAYCIIYFSVNIMANITVEEALKQKRG